MRKSLAAAMAALSASMAPVRALEAIPPEIASHVQPGPKAFDTIVVSNGGPSAIRVDSITIRFLDGSEPRDFAACKTCDPKTLSSYVYGGWLYGASSNQSLGYLRDSLFLLQDDRGAPVSLEIGAGASVPFALYFPVNCPFCGRPASYPRTTRYAYAFIASDGSRAGFQATVGASTALKRRMPGTAARPPALRSRDAAGRLPSRAVGPVFGR